MIQAIVHRNAAGQIDSFKVANHGESYVCAAVSMLVINTINSIEALTDAQFVCNTNEEEGQIDFSLTTPRSEPAGQSAGILIDAMALGLEDVAAEYPNELTMTQYNKERE